MLTASHIQQNMHKQKNIFEYIPVKNSCTMKTLSNYITNISPSLDSKGHVTGMWLVIGSLQAVHLSSATDD